MCICISIFCIKGETKSWRERGRDMEKLDGYLLTVLTMATSEGRLERGLSLPIYTLQEYLNLMQEHTLIL